VTFVCIKKETKLSVRQACKALDTSQTAFRHWLQPVPETELSLLQPIQEIVEEFPGYGYRRVTKALPQKGVKANHKKVLKTMKENRLTCKKRKTFKPATTDSNHSYCIQPNRVKSIHPISLNQIWVADITYVRLPKGFAYLAVIMDRYSRRILGWKLSRCIDSQLTVDALTMALNTRQGQCLDGLIHHSDRGVQYACHEYTGLLEQRGILASMSAKGNPYDNAYAESLFKTIKREEVYVSEYESFEDAYQNIEHFIEQVYNEKRLHSAIGYQPPAEFEQKILKEEVA
jgi:transposase InsO family protein